MGLALKVMVVLLKQEGTHIVCDRQAPHEIYRKYDGRGVQNRSSLGPGVIRNASGQKGKLDQLLKSS